MTDRHLRLVEKEPEPMPYAVVMPASKNRRGWMVAYRTGDSITHHRLESASIHDPEAARDEAARLLPDRLIIVPALGDKVPL